MGVGPDQSLSCLHSSHSKSRSMTTAVLGPNLSGPAPVAKWKQYSKDCDMTVKEHAHRCSKAYNFSLIYLFLLLFLLPWETDLRKYCCHLYQGIFCQNTLLEALW